MPVLAILVALCPIFVLSIGLPPGGIDTVYKNLRQTPLSWNDVIDKEPRVKSFEDAKRLAEEAKASASDPYGIDINDGANWTVINFTSLLYKDRGPLFSKRYIMFNKLPAFCEDQTHLPYVVFLPGYGASPEDYSAGFPFMQQLVENGTICCFYAFMPYFFNLPFGGFWYTNNGGTVPEYYLFTEVLTVIKIAMGNKVTDDPQKRILAGHSMGGYGAVMNAMRTNMEFFGSVCALNGGLYIWNLPEFQDAVTEQVLEEAIARKNGSFLSCSYTQPPYRYYADEVNFKTIVATSLASVFHDDGSTAPKDNNPWFSATLFDPNCNVYVQSQGFRFWLNADGSVNTDMFQVSTWYSPLGFLHSNWPALRPKLNNSLYLSTTYNDTLVDFTENLKFSEDLLLYNISHVLDLYHGSHYDVFQGVEGCLSHFAPRVCGIPEPDTTPSSEVQIPLWAFILAVSIAAVLLVIVVIQLFSRKSEYSQI